MWQVQIHEDHLCGEADAICRRAYDFIHHLQDVW